MDPQETVIWAASQVERWFSGYRLSWFVPETPESFNGQLAGTRQLHDFPKGTGSSTSHLISRRVASKMVSRSISCKIHDISIEIFYFHRNILVILVMMVLWCPQSNLQSEKTFCVGFRWWNQWWIPPQPATTRLLQAGATCFDDLAELMFCWTWCVKAQTVAVGQYVYHRLPVLKYQTMMIY